MATYEITAGYVRAGEVIKRNMKITQAQGNGHGQCALCKKRGKWNVQWMCFLYEIEGKEGVYCKNCADEIMLQIAIDAEREQEE